MLAVEALNLMEQRKITSLVVVDAGPARRGRRPPARPVAHRDVLMTLDAEDLARKAAGVRLLLFDVDGVLTDGRILLHADGVRVASSSTSATARASSGRSAPASRSASCRPATRRRRRPARAAARHPDRPPAGQSTSSHDVPTNSCAEQGLDDADVAYMGDDVLDLPVLSRVGLSAAPADAAPDVLRACDWVSRRAGGDGAARELIELLLRAQGKWEAAARRLRPRGGSMRRLRSRCSPRWSPCWSGSPSARRGSATSCATGAGSTAARPASRRTTCSA